MELGFDLDALKKSLNKLEVDYDWVEGKKETLLSYFSIPLDIIKELSDEELFLKHSSRLHHSIIIGLFELEPLIYCNNEKKDTVLKLSEREAFFKDSFNKLYFTSAKKSIQENFDTVVAYELSNYMALINDEMKYCSKVQPKEELENTVKESLLSDHLLINFLLKIKLNSIEKQFDALIKPYLLSNQWLIEDRVLLIKKLINNLQKGLLPDKLIQPLENMLMFGYGVHTSKATSDNYLKKLISIYNSKLESLGAVALQMNNSSATSTNDNRIDTDLTTDEIRNYFSRLNKKNKNKKEILSKEDVEIFISSNFIGFPPKKKKVLNPDIGKEALRYLIYHFYSEVDARKYDNKQKKYCRLLIDNFKQFQDKKVKILTKKLSSPKPKYYPFD